MALEPSQQAMHDDSSVKMPAFSAKNGNGSPSPSANPEVLRWRAEVLLDEMMLGGVDVAAGEPSQQPFRSTATPSPAIVPPAEPVGTSTAPVSVYANGHGGSYTEMQTTEARSEVATEPAHYQSTHDYSLPASAEEDRPNDESPVAPPASESESPQPWVLSAEERYRNLARQQALSEPSSVGPAARNGEGFYEWSESAGQSTSSRPTSHTDETATASTRVVRSTAAQFVNSGGGAAIGAKRSNLLPRLSPLDVEAVQQEIYTLQSEIDVRLPASHESNKRAHHLLEKALAILQADPTRSAEVEYYLQQVRTIFQRVQQTIDWSSVYRNRLSVYLSAWTLLAVIVLVATYLYPAQIENALTLYAGLVSGSLAIQQAVIGTASLMAGALGGAIGIFFSLHYQSRIAHGFVDRKFGLRGLILPVIGAVVGFGLALVINVAYYFLGMNPIQSLLLSVIPVFLAFGFGISQELLYGTRD